MKKIHIFNNIKLAERIFVFVLFSLIIGITSCEVLDIEPTDRFADNIVWNDVAYIEPYISQTYRNIPNGMLYSLINLSHLTDDAISYKSWAQDIQKGLMTPSTNASSFNYWSWKNTWSWNVQVNISYWKPIKLTNVFMANFKRENLTDSEPATLNRMEGEMRTIRAYSYLRLIDIYGGVPLVTKPFSLDDNFDVPRNSYDEVMQFVLEELDKAIPLLTKKDEYSSDLKGHLTKGAAMAIKARALLHYASPLHNTGNDRARWQAAADAAKAVIDLHQYSLFPDYHAMFLYDNIFNSEMIWQRPYRNENGAYMQFSFPELSSWPNGYHGYGQVRPVQNLVDAYETTNGLLPKDDPAYDPQKPYVNRDPRFYATLLHDGMFWKGREVESFIKGEEGVTAGLDSPEAPTAPWNASQTSYYSWKFTDTTVVKPGTSGVKTGNAPWTWIRYAEVLLNYAEANYFLGNEDIARNYVNMVRSRPGVNMPDITESGNALLQRIMHERRIELVFEEQRWFDIRRWKTASQVMNVPIKKMKVKKYLDGHKTYEVGTLFDAKFEDKDYLFPIPQAEIEKNAALEQNPGYN